MKDFIKWKTMRRPKRQHDRILGCRSLKFKVELPTEPFAKCESPGPVYSTSKRGMQDQLHAATVIEESFENEILLRRHHSQDDLCARKVFNDLFGCAERDSNFVS